MGPLDGSQRVASVRDQPAAIRVATLTGPLSAALVHELAADSRLVVRISTSPDDLVALVDRNETDAALVFVDETPGWPVSLAERLAARLGGRVPLVIVCDSAADSEVIEQRLEGPSIRVLLRGSLTAGLLADAARAAALHARP